MNNALDKVKINNKLMFFLQNNLNITNSKEIYNIFFIKVLDKEKVINFIFNDKFIFNLINNLYKDEVKKIVYKLYEVRDYKIKFSYDYKINKKNKLNESYNYLFDFYPEQYFLKINSFFSSKSKFLFMFGDIQEGKTSFVKYYLIKNNYDDVVYINSYNLLNNVQKCFINKDYKTLENIKKDIYKNKIIIFDDFNVFLGKKHTLKFIAEIFSTLKNSIKNYKIIIISDDNFKNYEFDDRKVKNILKTSIYFYFLTSKKAILKKYIRQFFEGKIKNNKDINKISAFILNQDIKTLCDVNAYINNFVINYEYMIKNNKNISEIIDLTKETLNNSKKNVKKNIDNYSWEKNIKIYLSEKKIKMNDLMDRKVNKDKEFIKKTIVYFLRNHCLLSYERIGKYLKRDKTNCYKKHKAILNNIELKKKIEHEIKLYLYYY